MAVFTCVFISKMLTSIRLDNARRLLLSAARRGLVAKKVTIAKGKKQGKQMKVWVRSTPKPLKRGMTTAEAGIKPGMIKLHKGRIKESAITKHGDKVDFYIRNGEVVMFVNLDTDSGSATNPMSSLFALSKLSKKAFSQLPNNTIVHCKPSDISKEKRESKRKIYSAIGFSDTNDGVMVGVVKSGVVLKPDKDIIEKGKELLFNSSQSVQTRGFDVDDEDPLLHLFGDFDDTEGIADEGFTLPDEDIFGLMDDNEEFTLSDEDVFGLMDDEGDPYSPIRDLLS